MKKRAHGFTLIELILYIGLLSSLIVVMSQIFIAILNVKLESGSVSVVQQDGTYIQSRIAYDVRRASRILSPAIGQTGSVLSLTIVENGVDKTYSYSVSGSTLVLSDGTSTDNLEGTRSAISQFQVTRVGNSATISDAKDTVDVRFTLTSNYILSHTADSMSYQFASGLR
jgi:type II secretory pathway pseudopilin PulG